MGTVRRIVLRFDRRWWDAGSTAGVNFFHGAGEPFPVWWTAAPAVAEILTGWVGGPPAEAFRGQSEDRVIEAAVLSLASVFGAGVGQLRRGLEDAFTYDWATDPYTAGAYCYGGVGAIEAQRVLSAPVRDTLFLAGEALADQGGIGTVHGAVATARRAADALLRSGPS
jgi:monoamine oxidase